MGTYQGKPTTREDISAQIRTMINGAVIDARDNTVFIPNLKLAIIVEIWHPNQYDRFSLCYNDGKEFKVLIDRAFIYTTEYCSPANYVANFCIKYALEKYYCRYLTDSEEMEVNMNLLSPFVMKMLNDKDGFIYFR